MFLIIDGYNILKQMIRTDFITSDQRKWFLNLIAEYCAKKHHQALIVFDGGPDRTVSTSRHGDITVVYSGAHISADDYIKDFIEQSNMRDMLLVSSDTAIYHTAKMHNVPTIESGAFHQLLKEFKAVPVPKKKKITGQIVKIAESENLELDEFMKEASNQMMYKDLYEEQAGVKKPVEQKLTKHEKRMLKISKKL